MIKCPRCESPVDETTRDTCPLCFTPLNAAPIPLTGPSSPSPAQTIATGPTARNVAPAGAASARVSLTGEEFSPGHTEMPPAAPANFPHGTAPASPLLPPRPSSAQRPMVPGPYGRREVAQDNSERGGLATRIAIYLMLILCITGGGWWSWMHRTNPKGQVQHLLHATQWLDWGVVWDLSSPKPGNKARHEFVAMMNDPYDNPLFKIGARHRYEKITFDVADPTYIGDEAIVNVSVSGSPFKRKTPIPFHLRNFGGNWKVEPIAENPLQVIGAEPTSAEKDEQDRQLRQMIQNLVPKKSP